MIHKNIEQQEKNEPECRFSAGTITATVWLNPKLINGEKVNLRSVTVQRAYKDSEDKWQHTTSFHVNDLPKLAIVLNKAYEHLTKLTVYDSQIGDEVRE